jgi:hypothetical protein
MKNATLSLKAQNLLFGITLGSIAATTAVIVYIFLTFNETSQLKAQIRGQLELQETLIKESGKDSELLSHVNPEVSYVLNRYTQNPTYRAAKGDTYSINSLGLRGKKIGPKQHGTQRIAIVGDSVVFGWKLSDHDRLESVLARRIETTDGSDTANIEFVTVGLPGWNVRDQIGFLRSHLLNLDLDLIIWYTINNDINDSAGLNVQGQLANWLSPHKTSSTVFTATGSRGLRELSFTPFVLERIQQNFTRIEEFGRKTSIPIVLVMPDILSSVSNVSAFSNRTVTVPISYRQNPKWPVAPGDGHPSKWANEQLSAPLLNLLVQTGHLDNLEFNENELKVIQDFEQTGELVSDPSKERERLADNYKSKVTEQFSLDQPNSDSIIYGISESADMEQEGAILLNNSAQRKFLQLKLSNNALTARYPRRLTIKMTGVDAKVMRSSKLQSTQLVLDALENDFMIPLNETIQSSELIELRWTFDGSECHELIRCSSAILEFSGLVN